MDSNMTSILILVLLVLMSAFFSATETAFSSLNRIKLKNLAGKGKKRAKLTLDLSENYDQVLSTILIGNNIVNIASASLATVIFTKLLGSDAGVPISTVVMTVIVLIFGEISPKSIAKDVPEQFAMFSAPVIYILSFILKPVIYLFSLWKKLLNKVFKTKSNYSITEEEILTMVEEARIVGGIDEEEGKLIRSAMEFDDLDAIDVCTPRTELVAIEDTADNEEIIRLFSESGYSRMPIYHEDIDHVVGVIHQKDYYNKVISSDLLLADIISPIAVIVPSMKISKLMKMLQKSRSHMALIIDEYGGTKGIVTLEDIIEELIGEIWDEHDEVVEEIIKVSDQEFRVLGSANLDKVFRALEMEHEFDFVSVNGWVTSMMGKIPLEGDSFQFETITVTVTKSTDRRVLEVLIKFNPVD